MFDCIDYNALALPYDVEKNKGRLITALNSFRVIKVQNFNLDIKASWSSLVNAATVIIGVMAQSFFVSDV